MSVFLTICFLNLIREKNPIQLATKSKARHGRKQRHPIGGVCRAFTTRLTRICSSCPGSRTIRRSALAGPDVMEHIFEPFFTTKPLQPMTSASYPLPARAFTGSYLNFVIAESLRQHARHAIVTWRRFNERMRYRTHSLQRMSECIYPTFSQDPDFSDRKSASSTFMLLMASCGGVGTSPSPRTAREKPSNIF